MAKKIYTVATSHLDTVWSWDFETTTSKYIYNTLVENFALLKKYPSYVFSFEGSYRYELMEEYYPKLFEELKAYVADGRWNVTGSAFENGDVNCPSPEALFRNILIGNSYFDEKFGKRSCDIFLPDCFGFGWALPSIAHHSHLLGFTTQKLAWGSAYGTPFDIGKWYGVDGNYIYACVNPHDYNFTLTKLRDWDFVQNKLKENENYGVDFTYIFHGVGDRGGSPKEATVKLVDNEIKKNGSNDIEVIAASADQIYRDIENTIPDNVKERLPEWKTELVMQNHGVGGYTSRAIGKRWNAKCQELADVAERAGVLSSFFGAADYNEEVIEKSWKRAIAHQFHDDTPGTSVQRAYKRSWNDYAMSINQLSGEIEASLAPLTKLMRSDFCAGIPVMVFNSVETERKSPVRIRLSGISSKYIRVFGDNGKEVPSQVIAENGNIKDILFLADLPSLGVRVFDVRPSKEQCKLKSKLTVSDTTIENQKYVVTVSKSGNITSIIDKTDNERELLSKPVVLGLFNYTGSKDWPAWEMNYKEANKEPDRVPELASFKIIERGPVRATFEVIQRDKKSEFKSYISLADSGETVEVRNEIEWQSMRTLLKNRFSFTAENEKATFDLGLGTIERENMSEKLFEVPAQKWADITDKSGDFGVSVLSECKYGWDKFDDNTLRLTVIHTPKRNYRIDSMQSLMDLGLNLYSYAIYSHKGKVGASTQREAELFTYPPVAVRFTKHKDGGLGTCCSFGNIEGGKIILRALKKKHHAVTDELVVRFNEAEGREQSNVTFTLGNGIESAYEAWASEEYMKDAELAGGKLVMSFKPFEVKTFVLKLKSPGLKAEKLRQKPIELNYNADIDIIPENLRRKEITVSGVTFKLGDGQLRCGGEVLPSDKEHKIALLCTNMRDNSFVNNAFEEYARWDLYDFGETAYIKDGKLAYEFTHTVQNGKVQYAKGLYYWLVFLDSGEALPDNKDVLVLAATEIENVNALCITPLIDEIENNRPFTFKKNFKEKLWYFNSKLVWNLNDKDDFLRHNNNGKNGKRVEQPKRHTEPKLIR